MELDYFKDKLFDLLNDSEEMGIIDLNADERNNLFIVRTEDGNTLYCYLRSGWRCSVSLQENAGREG